MTPDDASWTESRKLILAELERMERTITSLGGKIDALRDNGRDSMEKLRVEYDRRINDLNISIAMMQTKIAVGASVLATAVSVIVSWLMKGH